MHGLVIKAFKRFLKDSYGLDAWCRVADEAGLGFYDIETLAEYPDTMIGDLLDAATRTLSRDMVEIAEDVGIYLVSHREQRAVRRLLRFGGGDFVEFLHSLDDLPDRARLAVPGLVVPDMSLTELDPQSFFLACEPCAYPAGPVMVGILRAMADDYGALAVIEHCLSSESGDRIAITVPEIAFAEGRTFELAEPGAGA